MVAWAVLALGVAVLLFHAAAFSYFWMTLGLFPAVAFTLSRDSLRAALAALLAAWCSVAGGNPCGTCGP